LLTGPVAHAAIHLGYGFELGSKDVAIEALALTCATYSPLHKYTEDPSYSKRKGDFSSNSLLEVLDRVQQDKRLNGLVPPSGTADLDDLMEKAEDTILEYWNAWDIQDATADFEQSQRVAVSLLTSSGDYNFFMVHALTSSHAVRILLPLVPGKFQTSLVRQWWLFALAVYIGQNRPRIDGSKVSEVELDGRGWKHVEHMALAGQHALDSHYVKAIRAIQSAADTWGDPDRVLLKSAVRFASEFKQWKF
jgi:hypothetical protein